MLIRSIRVELSASYRLVTLACLCVARLQPAWFGPKNQQSSLFSVELTKKPTIREFGLHLALGVNVGSVGGSLAARPKPGEQRAC